MAAYWMVRGGAIKDEAALKEYSRLWPPIAERFGAEVIARGEHQTPEGPDYPRALLVKFPSYQQALECYEDAEYKVAAEFMNKACDRELIIIGGV